MPPHYVYSANADSMSLNQGDILERTPSLVDVLTEIHPHYGKHPDYKYFMVLTQSCGLVRRDGKPPGARYLTLAAVRPVEDALSREAEAYQESWQRKEKVVGAKARDRLQLFMERLIDNNEAGYFYLHQDPSVKIYGNNCEKIISRGEKFKSQAHAVLTKSKVLNMIQGKARTAIKADLELATKLSSILSDGGVASSDVATNQILDAFAKTLGRIISDENFPDRDVFMNKLVGMLMADAQITALLRD